MSQSLSARILKRDMKRYLIVAMVVLCLPVLLHIYQPGWQLGGLGLMLGAIGYTLSPLILFSALMYVAILKWQKK